MDAYQAGQQLGTLLFGGAATTRSPDGAPSLFDALSGRVPQGDVYNKTLLTGAQAQNAMQEARMNRAKALIAEQQQNARGRYLSDFQGAGLGDLAQLAADAGLGADSSNPAQILGLLSQARATQAANSSDDAAMNRNIAVFAGKPLELSTTNGGITTANPYTAPMVAPNAVGQATIAAHNAAAQDSLANAARARAGIGADKAGNYEVLPTQNGYVRVNKLTGATDAVKLGDAALQPAARPAFGSLTTDDISLIAPPDLSKSDDYDPATSARARIAGAIHAGARTAGEITQWALSHPAIAGAPLPNDGEIPVIFNAPTHASQGPYQDGTKLRGPGGKLYVVLGGVPVPVQ